MAWEKTATASLRLVVFGLLASQQQLTPFAAVTTFGLTACVGFLAYVPLLIVKRRRPTTDNGRESDGTSYGALGSYSIRIWLGALGGILLARIDQTLMIPLSTNSQLALYAVAVTISEATLIFNSAVRDVVFASQSGKQSPGLLERAARISTLMTAALCAGTALLCVFFISPLFGKEFGASIPVVMVLLVGTIIGNPGSVAGAGLSAAGKPQLRSYSLLMACTINIVAVLILVPGLGAMGAAIATLIGNVVAGFLNLWFQKLVVGARIRDYIAPRREDFHYAVRLVRRAARRP
ncbi:MATE family efflux transporter [Arthrobacter cheniae]|uniref:polysaccharide biosynthesis C-terminal domain-containing protein n=1 Tax=Arthrobacter cheniae TaxID=1258888 RepID=UPI001C7DE080|nr:polysaccharide biosynthesis C-terminal domain-containing protein [Arthrobacter cheniae]